MDNSSNSCWTLFPVVCRIAVTYLRGDTGHLYDIVLCLVGRVSDASKIVKSFEVWKVRIDCIEKGH